MGKLATKRKSLPGEEWMKDRIVIDEGKGLVFESEDDLYSHFLPQIRAFENEYFSARKESDIPESEFAEHEDLLNQVLDDPDEIWEDAPALLGVTVRTYIGHFSVDHHEIYYVALVYVTGDTPSFVYLHFPSRDHSLVERFRRGDLVYDRALKEVELGAVEGDALGEGDDLAIGLYRAMLTLRSESDIQDAEFKSFEELREGTIEEPDEVWRATDSVGNVLVSFIREFPDGEIAGLHYVVITVEDTPSSTHALLFSFPTCDANLVDRYRHGENLHAEEVTQQASH